jgi:hypothetical protein
VELPTEDWWHPARTRLSKPASPDTSDREGMGRRRAACVRLAVILCSAVLRFPLVASRACMGLLIAPQQEEPPPTHLSQVAAAQSEGHLQLVNGWQQPLIPPVEQATRSLRRIHQVESAHLPIAQLNELRPANAKRSDASTQRTLQDPPQHRCGGYAGRV